MTVQVVSSQTRKTSQFSIVPSNIWKADYFTSRTAEWTAFQVGISTGINQILGQKPKLLSSITIGKSESGESSIVFEKAGLWKPTGRINSTSYNCDTHEVKPSDTHQRLVDEHVASAPVIA